MPSVKFNILTAKSVDIVVSLFSAVLSPRVVLYHKTDKQSMKSWRYHDDIRASWDEIFGVPPHMKLNPLDNPTKSDFIPRKWDLFRRKRI